jgi:hypothetical protein
MWPHCDLYEAQAHRLGASGVHDGSGELSSDPKAGCDGGGGKRCEFADEHGEA